MPPSFSDFYTCRYIRPLPWLSISACHFIDRSGSPRIQEKDQGVLGTKDQGANQGYR